MPPNNPNHTTLGAFHRWARRWADDPAVLDTLYYGQARVMDVDLARHVQGQKQYHVISVISPCFQH